MATNMPPHNLGETIDAVLALSKDPDITVEEMMEIIFTARISRPAESYSAGAAFAKPMKLEEARLLLGQRRTSKSTLTESQRLL